MSPMESQSNANHDDLSRTSRAPGKIPREAGLWLVPILLGLCGVTAVLMCTSRYGAGLSADCASYLSATRSVLAGKGYLYPNGQLCTQWPPLFPTLLAGLSLLGMDPLVAARVLNAIAFGLIVLISGRLFAACMTTRRFAFLGMLTVLVSAPLLDISVMFWSEPVFIVLTALFVLCMPAFLRTGSLRRLIVISALAGLACLQRYAGVTVILAGLALILSGMPDFSIRRRLRYAAGFCALAAAPLAAWLARNYLLAGRAAGGHHLRWASVHEIEAALASAGRIVATWLLPDTLPNWTSALGLGVAAALVIAAVMPAKTRQLVLVRCAAVFAAVYFVFLVFCGVSMSWPLEPRLLSPIYVPIMLAAFVALEASCRALRGFLRYEAIARTVGLALCAVWFSYSLPEVLTAAAHCTRDGPMGYGQPLWRDSPMMAWLRGHSLQGGTFSNVPDGVYILTGIAAEMTPLYEWDVSRFAGQVSAEKDAYIVWSYSKNTTLLLDDRELASRYKLEEMMAFPDGRIYRVCGVIRPKPWVSAVYRFWSPATGHHFYTIDRQQRDELMNDASATWAYENAAFYAFPAPQAGTCPVYHFRSKCSQAHFYTVSEVEKAKLVRAQGNAWAYEGVAFYTYADKQAEGLLPVHRLWSPMLGSHFYTAGERERERLLKAGPRRWIDEGVAWYAYGP
jgi:hypothetical protein